MIKKTYTIGDRHVVNPSEKTLSQAGITEVRTLPPLGYEEPATDKQPSELDALLTRSNEIQRELADMDYLTSKYVDGEDMSEYGDWQDRRRRLREEYRELIKKMRGE